MPSACLPGTTVWADASAPELIGMYLLLAVLLIGGGLLIAWAARRFKHPDQEGLTAEEQLQRFRDLKERGQMSDAEFERVRELLEPGRPADSPPKPPAAPDAFTARGPGPTPAP